VVALTPFVIGLLIVKEPLGGHRRPLFRQSRAFR